MRPLLALVGTVLTTAALASGSAAATPKAQPTVAKSTVTAIGKLATDLFNWRIAEGRLSAGGAMSPVSKRQVASLETAMFNAYSSMVETDPAPGTPGGGPPNTELLYSIFQDAQANEPTPISTGCLAGTLATKCLAYTVKVIQKGWKILDTDWVPLSAIFSAGGDSPQVVAAGKSVTTLHHWDQLIGQQVTILSAAANAVIKAAAKTPAKK